MKKEKRDLEETLMQIALKIAKQGKGCLMVIEKYRVKHDLLLEQDIQPFSVYGNERRAELLAMNDGGILISPRGIVKRYSVMIKTKKTLKGYGTRHAAALTASEKNTVILSSEEDRKVRIFKNSALVMQIDSMEKGIEKKVPQASNILESLGVGTLSSAGFLSTTALVPGLIRIIPADMGVSVFSGILLFGTSAIYYLTRRLK